MTLIRADLAIARYREILKDYEARGWKMDMDKLRETRERVAYAIPSPGRKDSKGWVLDPVPMIEPSELDRNASPTGASAAVTSRVCVAAEAPSPSVQYAP